jgi:hypothetical protein
MPVPVSWQSFLGEWRGTGRGSYPDVAPFSYLEETVLALEPGWGMVRVTKRTWLDLGGGARGEPQHLEQGLIILRADGILEYGCAQDSGRIESMRGVAQLASSGGVEINWVTTSHGNDSRLARMGRAGQLDDDRFTYQAFLSTVLWPDYRQHLGASLERI